jgi:hypothetical protein
MIEAIEFERFRGFLQLQAQLSPHAYIVRPNSAGKSTVLEAIGLAVDCLRTACRKAPAVRVNHKGRNRRGFLLPTHVDNVEDPVRHKFSREETLLSIQWDSGGRVNIVWPQETESGDRGFFYIDETDGTQPVSVQATRKLFSSVTVVPVVAPLDRFDNLKNPAYVEANVVLGLPVGTSATTLG